MKNKIFTILLSLFCLNALSQENPLQYRCGMLGDPNLEVSPSSFIGGRWKPARTDIGGTNQYGPVMSVLLVFVQFQNESADGTEQGWTTGNPPAYINDMIAEDYDPRPDYWNAYSGKSFSKYWCEVSRGSLHMVGKAIYVPLAHSELWYSQQFSDSHATHYRNAMINKEIYDYVKTQVTNENWPKYDQWTYLSDGNFLHQPDEKLDMMIKIHRTITLTDQFLTVIGNADYEGMGFLGPISGVPTIVDNYEIYRNGNIIITVDKYWSNTGSGMTLNGRGTPASKDFVIDVAVHEYCHYLMGSSGHMEYAKMGGTGWEFGFSPREMIKLDYIRPKVANYNQPSNILKDYSSRYGSAGTIGEILKVPVKQITEDDDEYFLIANRRKFSFTDFRMYGDTLPNERKALKQVNPEYGKGVYIYHNYNGLIYPSGDVNNYVDLECADGLWEWGYGGKNFFPFGGLIPTGKHIRPLYIQDNPYNHLQIFGDQMSGHIDYLGPGSYYSIWYSPGKTNTSNYPGLDRIYTNEKDFWLSLASYGDRWDAWNIGYNQVFSPYSSPNTNDWDDKPTGIFAYYESLDATQEAKIKVYRDGEGGYNETIILQETPPSKPMGITSDYFLQTENIARPMITWVQNMEPDMEREDGTQLYKVYRALEGNMSSVPVNYQYIDEVYFPRNEIPYYVDYNIIGEPSYWPGLGNVTKYPIRYYVIAVDKYGTSSVPSDFGDAIGLIPDEGGKEKDGLGRPGNIEVSLEYKLNQNYPNPFNPVTNIVYEIKNEGLVILKVYDVTGKEISTLVNKIKQPGSYSVQFDGANLSSGVYFYSLKTSSGIITKKMLIAK